MEQWKVIEGFENYSISSYGRIRNDKRGVLMNAGICNSGYLRIRLCNNGVIKKFLVHRLVAQAFIHNPNNYPCVNHIDEDKMNNNINNLEWCTYHQNNNYGTRNGRISNKLKVVTKGRKPNNHITVDIDGVVYESLYQANKCTGVPLRHLTKRCSEYKGHQIKFFD